MDGVESEILNLLDTAKDNGKTYIQDYVHASQLRDMGTEMRTSSAEVHRKLHTVGRTGDPYTRRNPVLGDQLSRSPKYRRYLQMKRRGRTEVLPIPSKGT